MEITPEESILSVNNTSKDDTEAKPVTSSTKSVSAAARARAAARRRRILESSATRMNVVSGDIPAAAPSTDISIPDTEDNNNNDIKKEENEEKQEETIATTEDETKKSTSGTNGEMSRSTSSRIQQMRRRRFKTDGSAKKADVETTATSSEEKKIKEGDVFSKEGDQATSSQDATNDAKTELVVESDAMEASPGEEKKYLGVARMRRKRLAEKKKKEESDAAAMQSTSIDKRHTRRAVPSEKMNTVPIFLHLFVTLILFSAGLQIGLQQHSHIVWEEDMVVNGLSVGNSKLLTYFHSTKDSERLLQTFTIDDHPPPVGASIQEDEFSTEFSEDSTTESQKKIDPIFRMDLDELTQGPSFFSQVARIAVRCHRALLAMILFFPQTLLSIPRSIATTKCYPYFFFISAFLRQGSTTLLGATIPSKTDDDTTEDSSNKDIVSMMIAGAKEMVGKSVPGFSILKFLYVVLQEGRDDMMVMSCGLFFGLILPLMRGNNIEVDNHEEL